MNGNNYYVEEHEINLGRMFLKLLLNWKQILLLACIFSILGYGYAKYMQHEQVEAKPTGIVVEDEQNDENKMDFDGIEQNVYQIASRYEEALENEQNYMNNSMLMDMNPYHMISTVQDFEVSMEGDDVNINELTMIAKQLMNYALSSEIVTQIAEEYDCAPRYIRELIAVAERNNQFKSSSVSIASGNSEAGEEYGINNRKTEKYYFYVLVKSNDRQFSENVVNRISEYLLKMSEEITWSEFSFRPVARNTFENLDTSTISAQNDSRVRAFDYGDRLVKLNTIIENLEKAKGNSIQIQEEYEEEHNYSGKKYAFFGFIGGAVLMVLILILKQLLSSTFQTAEDYRSWFSMNDLGAAPAYNGKKKPYGLKRKILERLEGVSAKISQETFCEMASTNLTNVTTECKKVLLTGSIERAEMSQLTEELMPKLIEKCGNIEFVFAEDLLGNPQTRSYLQDTDGIVLVEKRNYSKIDDVREEIEIAMSLNKRILGTILL